MIYHHVSIIIVIVIVITGCGGLFRRL